MNTKGKSTDLHRILEGYDDFELGDFVEHYDIGYYDIVEFIGKDSRKPKFAVWVHDIFVYKTYDYLDAALAAAIAYRHEGSGHKADYYFIKGLGLK